METPQTEFQRKQARWSWLHFAFFFLSRAPGSVFFSCRRRIPGIRRIFLLDRWGSPIFSFISHAGAFLSASVYVHILWCCSTVVVACWKQTHLKEQSSGHFYTTNMIDKEQNEKKHCNEYQCTRTSLPPGWKGELDHNSAFSSAKKAGGRPSVEVVGNTELLDERKLKFKEEMEERGRNCKRWLFLKLKLKKERRILKKRQHETTSWPWRCGGTCRKLPQQHGERSVCVCECGLQLVCCTLCIMCVTLWKPQCELHSVWVREGERERMRVFTWYRQTILLLWYSAGIHWVRNLIWS